MKHNTAPTFDSATLHTDKELLAVLLAQPKRHGKVSELTRQLDACNDGGFIEFNNPDNKRLASQVAAYNSRHLARHFILRTHDLATYAVKVTKPAPRVRKAKKVNTQSQSAVVQTVNTPAVEAAKAVFNTEETKRKSKKLNN